MQSLRLVERSGQCDGLLAAVSSVRVPSCSLRPFLVHRQGKETRLHEKMPFHELVLAAATKADTTPSARLSIVFSAPSCDHPVQVQDDRGPPTQTHPGICMP